MLWLSRARMALTAVVLVAAAAPARAQDFRGSIVGTITDVTGGALPGVTLTVTNSETRVAQAAVTDGKGAYQVLYLNSGVYAIAAELPGFKRTLKQGVEVRVGDAVRADFVFETGAIRETVDVTARASVLETTSISGTSQYQTGFPLTFGNLYYDPGRDPRGLKSFIGKKVGGGIAGLDVPAWDVSGFYLPDAPNLTTDPRIQLGNNVRYFPSTLPNVRTDDLHLMDIGIYKNFSMFGRTRLQLRVEAINALNYTVLWNPGVDPRNVSFGLVNQDRNNPRDIQLGLRYVFSSGKWLSV